VTLRDQYDWRRCDRHDVLSRIMRWASCAPTSTGPVAKRQAVSPQLNQLMRAEVCCWVSLRFDGTCTSGSSILDTVHLAATMQGYCRLSATVDPVTRPDGSVSQGLRFTIEIVERVELVGDRFSLKGPPDEQKVGGKPAVRQPMC